MPQNSDSSDTTVALRQQAEALAKTRVTRLPEELSAEEVRELYFELQTHQIELELQNDELRRSHLDLAQVTTRYRELYDFAPVGYASITEKGLIREANLTLAEMLNVDRTQLLRRQLSSFINSEDQDQYHIHCRRLLSSGIRQTCTLRMNRADAEQLWVRMDSRPAGYGDDGLGVLRSTFFDITEQRRAEEELARVRNLELMGVLAGGIAHDFNNYLQGILGAVEYGDLIDRPNSKTTDVFAEIRRSVLDASQLTNQLLTFATGGSPIMLTSSFPELVIQSSRFHLRGSNVVSKMLFADDLWSVDIDRSLMNQVLGNIIINADQSMPTGGTITFQAENASEEETKRTTLPPGKYIKISIQDEGCGIPAAHLDQIFTPFFTSKTKGSGLGLSVAHSVVVNHGGLISVESELGKGTRFLIYLPATEERPAVVSAEVAATEGKGARILLMDDDPVVRHVICRLLKMSGFDVESASDGEQVLHLFRKNRAAGAPFDLVILDLTVPGGLGGKQTMEKLLEIDPQVKGIVSSGYSSDPVMADPQTYGFLGVVAKPYEAEAMVRAILKILQQSQPAQP